MLIFYSLTVYVLDVPTRGRSYKRLARGRLRMTLRAAADEEDVALSAFHSLCGGVAAGRFKRLGGRDDLWPMLATITLRKALDHIRAQRSRKRGGRRVGTEVDLAPELRPLRAGGPGDGRTHPPEHTRGL
jgi:DNA-directed RNA polymerase specialized sigma24 family protein